MGEWLDVYLASIFSCIKWDNGLDSSRGAGIMNDCMEFYTLFMSSLQESCKVCDHVTALSDLDLILRTFSKLFECMQGSHGSQTYKPNLLSHKLAAVTYLVSY